MKTRKLLILLISVPLAIWIVGVCLDVAKVTGNLTEPLTRFLIDFWFLAGVIVFIIWQIKKNKN